MHAAIQYVNREHDQCCEGGSSTEKDMSDFQTLNIVSGTM